MAELGDVVVHGSHTLDEAGLHLGCTDDLVGLQEVVGHCNQGVSRPWLEPVDGTAADQAREPHRPAAELFPHLSRKRVTVRRGRVLKCVMPNARREKITYRVSIIKNNMHSLS